MAQIPPGVDLNLIPAGMKPGGGLPEIGGGLYLGTAIVAIESVMMFFAILAVTFRLLAGWTSRRSAKDGLTAADCRWRLSSKCELSLTCSSGASLDALILSIAQSVIVMTRKRAPSHSTVASDTPLQCTLTRATSGMWP